jgi:hypothetical protein
MQTSEAIVSEPGRIRLLKAAVLIMVASFSLTMLPTRMERAMADSTITRRTLQVEHIKIDSTKKFAEVEAALDNALPQLDPAISAALANGDEQRARQLVGDSTLFDLLEARSRRAPANYRPAAQGIAIRNR